MCTPWGPSVSSGPHLESPQHVGPSLCPPETGPKDRAYDSLS